MEHCICDEEWLEVHMMHSKGVATPAGYDVQFPGLPHETCKPGAERVRLEKKLP